MRWVVWGVSISLNHFLPPLFNIYLPHCLSLLISPEAAFYHCRTSIFPITLYSICLSILIYPMLPLPTLTLTLLFTLQKLPIYPHSPLPLFPYLPWRHFLFTLIYSYPYSPIYPAETSPGVYLPSLPVPLTFLWQNMQQQQVRGTDTS